MLHRVALFCVSSVAQQWNMATGVKERRQIKPGGIAVTPRHQKYRIRRHQAKAAAKQLSIYQHKAWRNISGRDDNQRAPRRCTRMV